MQIDNDFGIIPDTQPEILEKYLESLVNVFPNATNPDSPAYVIADACAFFDSLNQEAMQKLWNSKNSNTASGLGLDILANTVLNLFRKPLTPSTCVIKVDIQNLLSFCAITINVTVAGPQVLPIGWSVTSGAVTPTPAYALLTAFNIPATGVYVVRVYSTDTTTVVPLDSFDTGDAVAGVTFNDVNNLAPANLGTCTIPSDWPVTSSILNPTPTYTPRQEYVYTVNGVYDILVYSDDLSTNVSVGQLNTAPAINNANPSAQNMIISVTNEAPNTLGLPEETDAQFAARRRYYLNVEGQTYYGMEKAIINVGAPALNSVFIQEIISDIPVDSMMIVKLTVVVVGPPINVPVGFEMTVSTMPAPSPAYKTKTSYTFVESGEFYIVTYSSDQVTTVGIGEVTGATSVITGVTVDGNLDPSIKYPGYNLGSRGYKVFLGYPQNGAGGMGFDTQDVYLQKIASACFQFHPLGTQFYAADIGDTIFEVNTPYSGYTSNVVLNPLQTEEASVTLTLVYNTNPQDSHSSNGIFDLDLITSGDLVTQLVDLINVYFRSKTLPTDLSFSINELSQLIQDAYTGIVALNDINVPFTFGTISPLVNNLVFLRKKIGFVFNLLPENFNFTAKNKDS